MRILCDHNVAAKYVEAFERAAGITVATVGVLLVGLDTQIEA